MIRSAFVLAALHAYVAARSVTERAIEELRLEQVRRSVHDAPPAPVVHMADVGRIGEAWRGRVAA